MKEKILMVCLTLSMLSTTNAQQKEGTFKMFEKSTDFGGFGGLSLQMLNGDYFLFGGQGAAQYGNYYFGGFGFSGDVGNYIYPLSFIERSLQRSSGGFIIGGISNTKQIFGLYGNLKLAFDQYTATPVIENANFATLSFRTISLLPSAGVVFRPLKFLQIRLGAGYNQSGLVADGGLENVPYRAPMFNFDINFGGF